MITNFKNIIRRKFSGNKHIYAKIEQRIENLNNYISNTEIIFVKMDWLALKKNKRNINNLLQNILAIKKEEIVSKPLYETSI